MYGARQKLKGRVVMISQKRTWQNSKTSGEVMSFDLQDLSGKIKCTLFTESIRKFIDTGKVKENHVYSLEHFKVKMNDRKYGGDGPYELDIHAGTLIEELPDDDDVPKVVLSFVTIADVQKKQKGDVVNVTGIVASVGSPVEFTNQQGKQKSKCRRAAVSG